MDLNALIAKQRAAMEDAPTETVDIVVGGELVPVEARKLPGWQWQELVAQNPPRKTSGQDAAIGYNQSTLPADYPAESLRVGGEPVQPDVWREMWAVLDSTHRGNVSALLWGLNVYQDVLELKALGKAVAGQEPASPANSGSPRAASQGGSRPRSRRTTTTKKAG